MKTIMGFSEREIVISLYQRAANSHAFLLLLDVQDIQLCTSVQTRVMGNYNALGPELQCPLELRKTEVKY